MIGAYCHIFCVIAAYIILFTAAGLANTGKNATEVCNDVITTGELQADFPGIIAHAIHSINQEALEYISGVKVTDDNGIPVVNPHLTSNNPILGNAPRLDVNVAFKTFSMNQLDWVLLHMDNKHYDMGSYGTLERLMHQMHMVETWSEIRELYTSPKFLPPSPKFCSCVEDTENNGIMRLLRFIALQIREPELMLGRHTVINGKPAKWDGNVYRYAFFDGRATYGDVLNQTEILPNLNSSQAWKTWKDTMLSMKGHGVSVIAKYLHCVSNPSIEFDAA